MRVCPKCGFEDHPMWRPRNSRVFCEFTKTDTVEWNDEELYKKIKEKHPTPYFDGHFLYHITRSGLNIERIEKSLHAFMGWGREGNPERVQYDSPGQTRFSQFTNNSDKVCNNNSLEGK